MQLTEIGQRIFGAKSLVRVKEIFLRVQTIDFFLFLLRNLSQNIQEMHKDHVPAVLPGFDLLGSTDVCNNQGMVRYISDVPARLEKLSDIRILTVQGHPEFTKSIVVKVVGIRTDKGIFTPEFARDAIRRNELRNDGVEVIARAIWKILGAIRAEN